MVKTVVKDTAAVAPQVTEWLNLSPLAKLSLFVVSSNAPVVPAGMVTNCAPAARFFLEVMVDAVVVVFTAVNVVIFLIVHGARITTPRSTRSVKVDGAPNLVVAAGTEIVCEPQKPTVPESAVNNSAYDLAINPVPVTKP